MAKHHVLSSAERRLRPSPSNKIKKPHQVRRSARLKAQLDNSISSAGEALLDQRQSSTSQKLSLKRKRDHRALSLPAEDLLPSKRPRNTTRHTVEQEAIEKLDPLHNWILNERWPSEYFEPDDQTQKRLFERDSWLEEAMAQPPMPIVQYIERDGFRYPVPMRKAPALFRRKHSDSNLSGSSEKSNEKSSEKSSERSRENKSTPYRDARYTTMLATKGSFLRDFGHQTPQAIYEICHQLLAGDQVLPQNSLFRDDLFGKLCWKLQERNEAMVIRDIASLIVPSAMNLAIYGDTHLDILMETVNEAWGNSIPVEGPRPQPDYAAGFARSAFTTKQLEKLDPLIGTPFDTSFFAATYQMFFPFLTCEVKCGAAALEIADRQNAHSMTIAVRSVVELYRAVKREKELSQRILGFSISHDHRTVRIYGHYAVIGDNQTQFYRHPIKTFDITSEEGEEKWSAYRFTKNVYDTWMPTHLERICSAVDDLPSSLDFRVSDDPGARPEEPTDLSQNMGSLLSNPDNTDQVRQIATPDTSVLSTEAGQKVKKRAKTTRNTKEPTSRRQKQ